jgi:hypothetical protein
MPRGTPNKTFKCDMVALKSVDNLTFSASIGRGGFWAEKVTALRNDMESMLKLRFDDKSSLLQLRQQAKKIGVSLLFARGGDFLYVRVWMPDESQKRLIILLREERTVPELKNKGLEVDLISQLERFAAAGHAQVKNGKWKLTQKGHDELLPIASAA